NSLDTDVPSCFNKAPRGTTADLLLNAVEQDIVTQFDALYIPSGGQWLSLVTSTTVLNFISYAYEQGLIIGTTCVGNRVVADANDIVNGSNVVYYYHAETSTHMTDAGATLRNGLEAVTDNRIVTGAAGGGYNPDPSAPPGYVSAPTSEICAAMVREALGHSYVEQAEVLPLIGESGINFNISADITDLDSELGDLFIGDSNITEVHARIFTSNNRTLVETVELTDDNGDMVYTGSYIGTIDGDYVIDIEVEDSNSTLEIERELAIFTVGTGSTLDPLLIGSIVGGGLLVVVVIVIIIRKRS
ncbi:MAG: DJ-1/PfpI family protein, partial [Candidatus Thorarchaeota archaeon]